MNQVLPDLNPSIRAEMARARMTQRQLASQLGITQSGVSRRLAGEADWSLAEVLRLCAILDKPLSTFLPQDRASA